MCREGQLPDDRSHPRAPVGPRQSAKTGRSCVRRRGKLNAVVEISEPVVHRQLLPGSIHVEVTEAVLSRDFGDIDYFNQVVAAPPLDRALEAAA